MRTRFPTSFSISIYFVALYSVCCLSACEQGNHTEKSRDSTVVISPLVIGLKAVLPDALKESSGLCYTDGNLWSFGDGGNANEIYKIDTSTGAILQVVQIENFKNVDWEDITADSSFIYVGDFGNNSGNRKDLKIIRIKKSDLNRGESFLSIQGEAIEFSYADQVNFYNDLGTDYDCESLIAVGADLYIFTKDGLDFKTRCYKIPKQPGNYKVYPFSSFDSEGKLTAAAFDPSTGEIALLGYQNKKKESFIWFLNDYPENRFFAGRKVKIIIGSADDWQTEGLDYISANRLFLSCESSKSRMASLYYLQKK